MNKFDNKEYLNQLSKWDNEKVKLTTDKNWISNYVKLKDFSLFNIHYAYIDTADYYADDIFIQQKIKVIFGKEFYRPENGYRVIFCRIRKWDEHRFLKALEKLKDKMAICGHTDYLDECKKLTDIINGKTA